MSVFFTKTCGEECEGYTSEVKDTDAAEPTLVQKVDEEKSSDNKGEIPKKILNDATSNFGQYEKLLNTPGPSWQQDRLYYDNDTFNPEEDISKVEPNSPLSDATSKINSMEIEEPLADSNRRGIFCYLPRVSFSTILWFIAVIFLLLLVVAVWVYYATRYNFDRERHVW